MLSNDWEQISGDVAASEYGATFAQLDTTGERVYGVRVVQVINMVDACGSSYDGAEYLTESSYVDVDNIPWNDAKKYLDSCGWVQRKDNNERVPYSVAKRLVYIRRRARDLDALAQWEHRAPTTAERGELAILDTEATTLRTWFSIPRMVRAEIAVGYGGFASGDSLNFVTLAEAMDYHGIPASALWHPSEYNETPESEADETDE